MNLNTMEALKAADVDWEGALKRFSGNTELFERFLRRFPEDKTYEQLTQALEAGNTEDAFAAAHTLKGVTANLGIDSVLKVTAEMVELLRSKKLEEARGLSPELERRYERICGILTQE
ncbi:MAG: Hpt domain-containing protein [Clostridium sp.]|nr:Hpt domain-containing protein [Clostridium sp.]